jgi:hypothetical protein
MPRWPKQTTNERFWAKVDKTQDCWLWIGAQMQLRNGYGNYGIFLLTLEPIRKVLAHRAIWELTYEPIPEGLFVCHSCDNPPCVRPSHLFLGTAADNNSDAIQKGRWSCGEQAGKAKLTEGQVLEIRDLSSSLSNRAIAKQFGIGHSQVQRIAVGQTWRHLWTNGPASRVNL